MTDKPDDESREHEPSEKKIADAIERGDTPVSRDLSLLGSLLGVYVALVVLRHIGTAGSVAALALPIERLWDIRIKNGGDAAEIVFVIGSAIGDVLTKIVLALFLTSALVGAGPQRPRVVWRRLRVDWSRLSLRAGGARIFGRKGVVEFAKSLAKILVATAIAGAVVKNVMLGVSSGGYRDVRDTGLEALRALEKIAASVSFMTLCFAIGDFVLSRLEWKKGLRMSRQEVVDERKQAEGDPLVRTRMRSLALDRARRRMLNEVGQATMVIANPTHFAVALRYVRDEASAAPIVVAKGQELLALKIREEAEERQIPVIEQPELARALYRSVEVGQLIPPEFYRAVAEIINFLATRRAT
ncbi:MAG: flagellar type III secretion system protein FlhB [Rhodoblastus sp.]|nr:flagellar type III secretion system protein FlhB [Rhodoblastus sp.]